MMMNMIIQLMNDDEHFEKMMKIMMNMMMKKMMTMMMNIFCN